MKKISLFLLLFLCFNTLFAQQFVGISLDDEPQKIDSNGHVNVDSLQTYNKELVTGSYIFDNSSWFTDETFTLLEKINYLKENKKSFQYFFFARNGKIEENVNIAENDLKFVKDVTFNYASWFIDKDKINIVMSGFSNVHGKFEYRLSYSFKKVGKDLDLHIFEKKLVAEDKLDH